MVMETPEERKKTSFLFRNRFRIYLVLLVCFIAWRIHRYRSWQKKRPDVFVLFEEYKRNNTRPEPTPSHIAAAESRRILAIRDTKEKLRKIDAFFATYENNAESAIVIHLARLANAKAELLEDRQARLTVLDWVLGLYRPEELPEEFQVEIIKAGQEKAALFDTDAERLAVLNTVLEGFPGRRHPWVAMHLASLKRDKATLLTDKLEKIALYDEILAAMQSIDHSYAGEMAAYSLNSKARLVRPEDALPLLDQIIGEYGSRRGSGVQRQVVWALEKKATLLEGRERMEVLDRILLEYRNHEHRFVQSVIASSIDKKLKLLENDPERVHIIRSTIDLLEDTVAARHIPRLRQALIDG